MPITRVLCLTGTIVAAALLSACSGESPVAPASVASQGVGTGGTPDLPATQGGPEYQDVSTQGGGGVYAVDGASLIRQPNGLQARMSIPTPQPGTYNYPAGKVPGHPEVFTLWIFVFNYPDLCTAPCDMNDLGVDKPAQGGAYNGGGHAVGGERLTIAGRIRVGEAPFDHPVITMAPLQSPETAEVHLAIAPHGALDPSTLPDEFRLPTGTPAFWWAAIFK